MKKAKKAGTDPYLSLLLHRNTPTQRLDSSPLQHLMSRRTKILLPATANLLKPRLCINVAKKLFACKQRQAHYDNKGAKDLEECKLGDIVHLFQLGSGAKEPVKTIVYNPRLAYEHMSFALRIDSCTSAIAVTCESLKSLSTEAFL